MQWNHSGIVWREEVMLLKSIMLVKMAFFLGTLICLLFSSFLSFFCFVFLMLEIAPFPLRQWPTVIAFSAILYGYGRSTVVPWLQIGLALLPSENASWWQHVRLVQVTARPRGARRSTGQPTWSTLRRRSRRRRRACPTRRSPWPPTPRNSSSSKLRSHSSSSRRPSKSPLPTTSSALLLTEILNLWVTAFCCLFGGNGWLWVKWLVYVNNWDSLWKCSEGLWMERCFRNRNDENQHH